MDLAKRGGVGWTSKFCPAKGSTTGVSPAQLMFGRPCRTFLPTARSVLSPAPPVPVHDALVKAQQTQAEYFNPRPAGPLDFPPPAGGGGVWTPPPMISAPGRRREKRKAAFESSRKIISKSFRSFFGSGQNWGLQGSKFQNFPKRFFDNKIFKF